jgi:predicted porin
MKKSLIALAVLSATGVATSANAQSSVTLYGVIDASVQYIQDGGGFASATAAQQAAATAAGTNLKGTRSSLNYADGAIASSVWGVRGTEDLGAGMKANFQLEGDIQTNNGGLNQNGIFRRQANASVEGGFGNLKFGITTNPIIAINGELMPVGSAVGTPAQGNSVSTLVSTALNYADFYTKNALTYTTPTFSGITGQFQRGFSNNFASSNEGSVTAWSLKYMGGPLELRAAGQQRNAVVNSVSPSSPYTSPAIDKTGYVVGAKYTIAALQLGAAYLSNTSGGTTGSVTCTAAARCKISGVQVGASYTVSDLVTVLGSYTTSEGSSLLNMQARYRFGPKARTTAYAMVGMASNGTDGKVNFNPLANNTGNQLGAPTTPATPITNQDSAAQLQGRDVTGFGFGIIHTF